MVELCTRNTFKRLFAIITICCMATMLYSVVAIFETQSNLDSLITYKARALDAEAKVDKLIKANKEYADLAEQMSYVAENAVNIAEKASDRADNLRNIIASGALGENNVIVDLSDVTVKSNTTESQLNLLLEGSPLAGYGWDFLEAERNHNINAIILISIIKQESGLGKSSLAKQNNNLGGIKTKSGSWGEFEDYSDCIDYIAELLKTSYLSEDGKYYNGKGLDDINVRYCINSDGSVDWDWSDKISLHTKSFKMSLE